MMMANPQQQLSLSEQVRMHGEMLARLTVLVEEDHKDMEKLKEVTEIIAKAVEARETREATKADIKARVFGIGVPLACSLVGGLAGHFIH